MFLQFYSKSLVYTNPTKIRYQDYQIHLRNLSILDRNKFFHFVFFEWPEKKVKKKMHSIIQVETTFDKKSLKIPKG
jgi:hypothetical protein